VTLTQPNAAFLAMLAHPSLVPVDKVLIGRFGDKWTKPEHIVTSGAYKLSQWVVNERIVAERNPRYWDNAHTVINKVTYLPITSEAADVNRYKAGEIDIVYTVPINQFAQLKKPWARSWMFLRSWRPITTNSTPPGRRLTMRACVKR
jgi:oligopeptide transport system substrate-binding protein